jgi:3-oxoacyl-[acyl-carrier protein] reductase
VEISRKVALITGAARGLGRHLTEAFVEKGYAVVVNYLHAEASAEELLAKRGTYALAIKADVGDLEQVKKMVRHIEDRFGRLDVVVNNAGIARDNLLLKQSEHEWDAILRTNLTGCFHVIREAAPLMIMSGGGHIINISSYAGIKGKAGQAAYSASKAALIGLTVTAARELADRNIMINAVVPGYMMTAMGSGAGKAAEQAKEDSILHVLADPSDVARSIVFLASARYITGQILSLDSRIR